MSGYCLDCGNDLCVCDELALEEKKMNNLKDIYDSVNDLDELDQYISGLHEANESLRSELLEADSQNDSLKQANEMLQEALKMKTEDTSSTAMIYGFLLGCILGTVVSLFASKIPVGE